MHKLFKLKARGPRIPQSRVRGQTEREGEWEGAREIPWNWICCVSGSICFVSQFLRNANVKIKSKMHKIYGVSLSHSETEA